MKKALIFLADGFEVIEALTVVDICRRAKVAIDMVSVTGKKEVVSSHQVIVTADCLYEEADFEGASMLILPGGMPGTRNLEAYEPLMARLDEWNEKGKWLAAICAAPSIFAHRGYLRDRDACSYPGFEDQLREGGARVNQNEVTVSGHLITARGMGCAVAFGLAVAERLADAKTAAEVAAAIVYTRRG